MILFRHRSRGFTLIELLVVITIIGILAGLAIPAVSKALDAARRAEAGAMVNQLRTALVSYETEYGTFPATLQNTSDQTREGRDLYHTLIAQSGGNNANHVDNPRRIVFMEFNAKILRAGPPAVGNKTPPSSSSSIDGFVDPWNQPYFIRADSDYSGTVSSPISAGTGSGTINSTLLVWSPGSQKSGVYVNTATGGDASKYIASWK